MPSITVVFDESTSQSRSKTVTIPFLKNITNISVNTGNVSYSVSGNNVTVNVSNGVHTRSETNSSSGYYEYSTQSTTVPYFESSGHKTCPSSYYYSDGYWSGTIPLSSCNYSSGTYWSSYSGQVSHYVSGSSYTTYYYAYTVTITYEDIPQRLSSIKVKNESQLITAKAIRTWNGSQWVSRIFYVYNGSNWRQLK